MTATERIMPGESISTNIKRSCVFISAFYGGAFMVELLQRSHLSARLSDRSLLHPSEQRSLTHLKRMEKC